MAVAYTNHGNTKTSSTAATSSGAITVAGAAGDTYVVAICITTTGIVSVTDSASHTYTELGVHSTNTYSVYFFGFLNAGAITTVTASFPSSRYSVSIASYSGVVAFNSGNTTTSTSAASPNTITLPNSLGSGNLAVAAMCNKGTATWGSSTGTLENRVAGAGSTTPGAAIVDNTATTCAATSSSNTNLAATAIELQSHVDVTVTPTGVSAAGAVTAPTISGSASVSLTGVSATSAVGSVTVTTGVDVNVTLTGVSSTSAVGTVSVIGDANVAPIGVSATGSTGTISISGTAEVSPTGVQALSSVGTVSVAGSAFTTLTGVQALASVGTVDVSISGGGGGGDEETHYRRYGYHGHGAQFDDSIVIGGE